MKNLENVKQNDDLVTISKVEIANLADHQERVILKMRDFLVSRGKSVEESPSLNIVINKFLGWLSFAQQINPELKKYNYFENWIYS